MIKLTKKELETLGENKDAIAQLLVRKAILEEMGKKEYTEEEKKYLEEMKLNMEIEFYHCFPPSYYSFIFLLLFFF